MKYTPRRLAANVNVTPVSPLKELAVLVGGLLVIGVGVYILLGLAVDMITPRISPALEKKIASPFVHSFKDSEDTRNQRLYVQALVDDLQARCTHLPYDIKVHIIQSSQINAAAFPGGHILVFTGLLTSVSSENELIFILGHELGHIAHRDHLRKLGRGLVLLSISAMLLGSDNAVSDLLSKGLNLTEMGFSRQQESQADAYGLDSLYCDFGHVAGATRFFSKMEKSHATAGWGHFFSSHPENARRITQLKKLAAAHGYPRGKLKPLPFPNNNKAGAD